MEKETKDQPLKDVIVTLTPDDVTALALILDNALRAGGMQAMPAVMRINNLMSAALEQQ